MRRDVVRRAACVCGLIFALACGEGVLAAQAPAATAQTLTIPSGTILDLALARRTRLHGAGEALSARLRSPVYVDNRLVLAAGSVVLGHVKTVKGAPALQRVEAGLGGDFSPAPTATAGFDAVLGPQGRRIPIRTAVEPALPVLHLATAAPAGKRPGLLRRAGAMVRNRAAGLYHLLRAQANWGTLRQEAVASLPYHPSALPAGTSFQAQVLAPFDVTTTAPPPLPRQSTADPLPPGLVLHARLETALSSATAHWGEMVRARVDRPVLSSTDRVLIPEGALLLGTVTAVRPSRRFGRGGQLHFSFSHLQFPAGTSENVVAALQAAAVRQPLHLDAEGNVVASAPHAAPALA
ncbi:MAG: hypothetical protein ACRD1Y_12365, partial [Terriglobales bacterium]